jgi:dTDP-4-amino-4,6-dideoxygalactose transaminase/lipopolysaccharide/colanic/teichoic acid biosynthesis glycosyltransferase
MQTATEQAASSQFLPFHLPLIEEDDMRAVHEVLKTGWITTGPRAAQFEQEFARYIGARHAIAVNSGTAALHVALDAIGVSEGDEVIVPTLTFAATAEAAIYMKARPVLVDCDPESFNLDPAQAERAITANTRAMVPVHFAGQPCAMDPLLETARAHNLKVIEDAAHALPARYHGRMIGTLGDLTCFSFYATKSITTGEGGMVTTQEDGWADRMRVMRLHGISKDAWKRYTAEGSWRYEILAPGFKYNLTDMQAALGISQLAKCERLWSRRSALAARYTEELGALGAFEMPTVRPDVEHAWHLYVIRTRPAALSIHRDRVIEELKQRGIGTSVHFIPLHLHPYYRDHWGYRRGDFPVAEDYFERCLSLPIYPAMSDDDQSRVIAALKEIADRYRRSAVAIPTELVQEPADHRQPAVPGVMRSEDGTNAENAAVHAAVHAPIHAAECHAAGERSWYLREGKRLLDLIGATAALAVGSPLLLACAAAVRFSSRGPIFFRQRRVGLDGRPFDVLKFRTMIDGDAGPLVTAAGDPRITSAGRWLRRWKLDELPQFFNVLKGEMSLVGPRPEVPEYVAQYSATQQNVLAQKPGITSPASLTFLDEEAVLAAQCDRENYYATVLLPQKLEIDLDYCRNVSLAADLRILLRTFRRLLPGKRDGQQAVPNPLSAPAPIAQQQRFQSCCAPEPRNQVAFSSRKRHLSPN